MSESLTREICDHNDRMDRNACRMCLDFDNAALRAEVERVTDVAYSHCLRADAREADIERITAHYAGAMELANRKVSLMTELLRRAVPLVAFCAPKDSTLGEEIRRAIHESEVRRGGYSYTDTYVESVEWQRDKAYARAEKLAAALREAPHAYNCKLMQCQRSHGHRTKPPCPCDCFKARALAEGEKP